MLAMHSTEAATLEELAEAEARCTRCDLYRNATRAVPGEGPRQARVMFVGEQPGDQEDLSGRPFVGPAGQMLDRALEEAGVARGETFVTNAVKHFKFEPRGKRRIHKKPDASEIKACRWWLEHERALVKPAFLVALGATAARSLLDRTVTISRTRGQLMDYDDRSKLLVTVHPSYLLRIDNAAGKAHEYKKFVDDLRLIAEALAA
jgi:uracil-DNA glycosylase family protein